MTRLSLVLKTGLIIIMAVSFTTGQSEELVQQLPNRSNMSVEVGETEEVSFLVVKNEQMVLELEYRFNGGNFPDIVYLQSNLTQIFEWTDITHPLLQYTGKDVGDAHALITTQVTNNAEAENVTGMTITFSAQRAPPQESLEIAKPPTRRSVNLIFEKNGIAPEPEPEPEPEPPEPEEPTTTDTVELSENNTVALVDMVREELEPIINRDATKVSIQLKVLIGIGGFNTVFMLILSIVLWHMCRKRNLEMLLPTKISPQAQQYSQPPVPAQLLPEIAEVNAMIQANMPIAIAIDDEAD